MSDGCRIVAKTKKVCGLKMRVTNPYCNISRGVELIVRDAIANSAPEVIVA